MSFTVEQIKNFKEVTKQMNSGLEPPALDPALLERMAMSHRTNSIGFRNTEKVIPTIQETVKNLITYRAYTDACGCLGPRDGWPWCPCEVYIKIEQYRFDIAIHILENHKEFESYEEAVAECTRVRNGYGK